jgi:Zn-dependent metalloprotease
MCQHNPIECIIPPHMLSEIYTRGTPEQRERAFRTAALSAQLRGERADILGDPAREGRAQAGGKQRIVYTAANSTSLPGTAVRSEGQPASGDAAVDEAYDGAGATYDLYFDIYARDSIDGSGMRLDSTVHYGSSYDNAFWNSRQMVYGDGDDDLPETQRIFNRFTIAIDIIGHELTHGVTQYTARLLYSQQSGALNESMSDVFGALVKQRILGQTAVQADWVIGGGLFGPSVNGIGIRSMKAPGTAYDDRLLGKDPQPAHIRDYVNTSSDNGGVHINSGIPNRAFYVTALNIGGNAWEKAGRIWYDTLRSRLSFNSNFQNAADATFAAAGALYGAGSLEQQAVRAGWADVGITIGGSSTNGGCGGRVAAALDALFGEPR